MKKPAKRKPKHARKAPAPAPSGKQRPQPKSLKASRIAAETMAMARRSVTARSAAAVAAPAYSSDDRAAIGLLLLPFMLLAFGLGASQSLKPALRWPSTPIERGHDHVADARPVPAVRSPELVPATPLAYPPQRPATAEVGAPAPVIELPGRIAAWPPASPAIPPTPTVPAEPAERMAIWTPPAPSLALDRTPPAVPAPPGAVCEAPAAVATWRVRAARRVAPLRTDMPEAFGAALAAAAKTQVSEFVIYSARYQSMAYPMGDVIPLQGACTDVVVRAYRALGYDLQEMVQRAHVGGGDANIEHRRTETLRRFFQARGEVLPITEFGEDYKPGDIVTYYRPFSRVSRGHIAIVSDVIGPNGRPMIIHNRGYGAQLEDALFVDRITGHYRYTGAGADVLMASLAPAPAAAVIKASYPAPRRQTASMPAKAK